MKIGMVCYPTYGGSGVIATELGKALAKDGHEVHFITYSQPTRLDFFSSHLFYHEVSIKSYPLFQYPPYEIALSSKLVDVALNEKLDLLHVHYAIPHASAAFMAQQILRSKGYEIPFVTTLHGTDITVVGKDSSNEPVVTFSINQSDGVTAVSDSLKEDTLQHFDVKNNIEVIPNFVDFEKFNRCENKSFRDLICPNCETLIVHTSNFRKVKRIEDVLKCFVGIREHIPAKLLLVGDGPERKNIEDQVREKGVCEHVKFLGKIDAVEQIFSVSDLFLMTSEKESFGLSALEAMACKVPVVSTNAGGLPELNKNGISGFTCNVGDIKTMVQRSIHILDKKHHKSFQLGAYKQAKNFDINKILPLYKKFYEKIIRSSTV